MPRECMQNWRRSVYFVFQSDAGWARRAISFPQTAMRPFKP
jgi:hypothetical protein